MRCEDKSICTRSIKLSKQFTENLVTWTIITKTNVTETWSHRPPQQVVGVYIYIYIYELVQAFLAFHPI